MNKDLFFKTQNDFDNYINLLPSIGIGGDATCYKTCNNKVIKYFWDIENLKSTKKELLQYSHINNDTYYFNKNALYINNIFSGIILDFCEGKTLEKSKIGDIRFKKIMEYYDKYLKDTKIISDMGILCDDVFVTNIMMNNEGFKLIDTDYYHNAPDNMDNKDVYNRNVKDFGNTFLYKIFRNNIKRFVNDNKNILSLIDLKKSCYSNIETPFLKDSVDIKDFLIILRNELSNYCDCNINTLNQAIKKMKTI